MIKLQNLTPEVYYKQSRDFQFIGRLYDIVLNYIKTNTTNLYNLPVGKNMDEQLLNLLALTLGFKATKNYNSKQLLAICSSLPTILKHKGSIQALVLATNALLAAEGVKQPLDYILNPKQGITIYVAQELEDLSLLTDLLDYLLPAGLSCTIIKETQVIKDVQTTITVNTDEVTVRKVDNEITISNVAPTHRLTDLAIGNVGISPSILANVTVVKKFTPLDLEELPETPIEEEGEVQDPEGGDIEND